MSYLFGELGHQWNNVGEKFTTTLFKALTERDLFSTDLAGGELSLKVKREVFDNRNILDTWTVVDIFNIPLNYNLPVMDWIDLGTGPFSIGLGLTFEVAALNIRQVRPQDIILNFGTDELKKDIKTRINDIEKTDKYEYDEERDILDSDSEGLIPWSRMSPLVMARYSKLINLISHPLRIPITGKRAVKMKRDEISSWLVSGTIQLGATVGWSVVNPTGLGDARLGAGISTYLNGRYQYSAHKEDDNFILLKVSRAKNTGRNIVFGNAEINQNIFSGFLVSDKRILNLTTSIIPFQVQVNKNNSQQFDVAYRYDLRNPEARRAYSHAVLGKLALSDELSQDPESGVTWAFQRQRVGHSEGRSQKTVLSLVFQKGSNNTISMSEAHIETPEGERQLFKAEVTSTRGHRAIWGVLEGKRYSFDVTRDDESGDRDDEGLIIEGQFNDNRTSSREMLEFMQEIEEAVQVKGLFPRIDIFDPATLCSVDEDCSPKLMRYGRSSFYYKLFLNRKVLDILKKTDEDDLWPYLEEALEVKPGNWSNMKKRWLSALWRIPLTVGNFPLNLFDVHMKQGSKLIMAKKIIKDWKEWRRIKNPKEETFALGRLVRSQYYGREMVRLVRAILKDQDIPFYVSAHAPEFFGSIVKSSDVAPPDLQHDSTTDIIDFDRMGPRINYDPKAKLDEFDINVVNKDEIQIRFVLPKNAHALYWRVDKIRGWLGAKKLIRLITPAGTFKEGPNLITLKRDGANGVLTPLALEIFANKELRVMSALALERDHWGELLMKDLRLR